METRTIEISLDTAKRWYEQGGELKDMALGAFDEKELIRNRLPKSWEEYRTMKGDEGEKANAALSFAYTSINGAFPDYHDAEKHIALMKLHLLRDEYRQGWLPSWGNNSYEYGIKWDMIDGKAKLAIVQYHTYGSYFLSFPTYVLVEEFLTNFRELIEQAGDLI